MLLEVGLVDLSRGGSQAALYDLHNVDLNRSSRVDGGRWDISWWSATLWTGRDQDRGWLFDLDGEQGGADGE